MSSSVIPQKRAEDFASTLGIDLLRGLDKNSDLTPILMPIDNRGKTMVLKRMKNGVDYYFSRIDYFDQSYHVVASRLIYIIMPGNKNQPAYLPAQARIKIFEVHRGFGYLILSGPETESDEGLPSSIYPISPAVTPAITVPADNFYVFEATEWGHEPLIVSELKRNKENSSLRPKEIMLNPNQRVVTTAEGSIDVPTDFYNCNFN